MERAADVGNALWADDAEGLVALAERHGRATDEAVETKIARGNNRQREPLLALRPDTEAGELTDDGRLTLEVLRLYEARTRQSDSIGP